jgi:hypothetical protein
METTKNYRLKKKYDSPNLILNVGTVKTSDQWFYKVFGMSYDKIEFTPTTDTNIPNHWCDIKNEWFEEVKPEKIKIKKIDIVSPMTVSFTMEETKHYPFDGCFNPDIIIPMIENGLDGCEFTKDDMIDFAQRFMVTNFVNYKKNDGIPIVGITEYFRKWMYHKLNKEGKL